MRWLRGVGLAAILIVGCTTPKSESLKLDAPAPQPLTPTILDYVDADGFDALFESALVNQDPAVIVRTGHTQPDWDDRLNAWIAAWNMAGRAPDGSRVRGQSPLGVPVTVNGESIREFRLLIESLWTRIGDTSRLGVDWLAEEKTRSRRMRLLKPYNLRFHKATDGRIELVFFHGRYAQQYREFVVRHAGGDGDEWDRTCTCTTCALPPTRPPLHLTAWDGAPR